MKKGKRLAVLSLVFALSLGACSKQDADTTNFMKVDETVITKGEYDKQFDLYKSIMAVQQGLDQQVRGMVIQDHIIKEDLKKHDIKIDSKEYQAAINDSIENAGGEVEFLSYVYSLGVEREVLEESIKKNLNYKKHYEWFAEENKASDEDIKAYFEEHKDSLEYVNARHILVETEDEAKDVIKRLEAGEKFEDVSNDVSIDTAANQNGGDLGKVTKATFDPDFVKAAFALDEKEISKPVKTKHGYHVIELLEKHQDMDEFKEEINSILAQEKYEEYMTGLMKEADVTYFDYAGKEIPKEGEEAPVEDEKKEEVEDEKKDEDKSEDSDKDEEEDKKDE